MGFFNKLVGRKAQSKKVAVKKAKPSIAAKKTTAKKTAKKIVKKTSAKPVKKAIKKTIKKTIKKSIKKAINKSVKPKSAKKSVKKTVKKSIKSAVKKTQSPKQVKRIKVIEFKDPEKARSCPECGSRRVRYSEFNQALICKECGVMYPELAPELEQTYVDLQK